MTNNQIEQFLTSNKLLKVININFRKREPVRGIFVNLKDFDDLKSKNLWRIITETKIEDWRKTKDTGLTRIYNGADFTKLQVK